MIKRLKKNALLKGIFYMGFGTIIAQCINVLIQPVLTRLVPAETLGIYTYIISMANILIPVASLKLEMLVVSERDENEAQLLVDVCLILNVIISIAFFIVIVVGYNIGSENVFNKYGNIIFLAPLLVLMNGIRFLFISYNNRYKKYKLITGVAILREALRAVIQVLSGLLSFGATGQVLGYALSPVLGLQWQTKHYIDLLKKRRFANFSKFKDILTRKGKHQILFLVPGQFINSFSSSLITISITSLFSASTLGYYSAGVRILEIPMLFITSNVNKVCFQKFSENVREHKPLVKTMLSLVIGLSFISFVGFGVLYLIAPQFSEIVFGKGYYLAGIYIKQLCVMYAIRLVATSFNGLFTIFEKQKYELALNIALIVVAGVAFICSKIFILGIESYLKIICIGYALVYFILLSGYYFVCSKYDRSLKTT